MRNILLATAILLTPAPALAQAGDFALVNKSGVSLTGIQIRRSGEAGWRALTPGLSDGARAAIGFTDPDCAFDISADITGGGKAVWTGVNLCEVRVVTLRRSASGEAWADYD